MNEQSKQSLEDLEKEAEQLSKSVREDMSEEEIQEINDKVENILQRMLEIVQEKSKEK